MNKYFENCFFINVFHILFNIPFLSESALQLPHTLHFHFNDLTKIGGTIILVCGKTM